MYLKTEWNIDHLTYFMFIIIGQSLPSRLVTQKLTLQKSQIIIVAIMKHMEEDFTPGDI